MKILIAKHIESEGPGTLGTFIESEGAKLHVVNLHNSEHLPDNPGSFDAIVSMGGPMNVYEDEKYPFLKRETEFLRKALESNIPVLGICLGAQMIARASNAQVVKSPMSELGWGTVTLTRDGKSDLFFQSIPSTFEVFQWHGDMFHVPDEGKLLASGSDCPNQAFRVGTAFGVQFHVEVTRDMLKEWFLDSPQLPEMLLRYDEIFDGLYRNAVTIYRNFVDIING